MDSNVVHQTEIDQLLLLPARLWCSVGKRSSGGKEGLHESIRNNNNNHDNNNNNNNHNDEGRLRQSSSLSDLEGAMASLSLEDDEVVMSYNNHKDKGGKRQSLSLSDNNKKNNIDNKYNDKYNNYKDNNNNNHNNNNNNNNNNITSRNLCLKKFTTAEKYPFAVFIEIKSLFLDLPLWAYDDE